MCHLLLLTPFLALPVFWLLPFGPAIAVYLLVAGPSIAIYWLAVKAMQRPVVCGSGALIGKRGYVTAVDHSWSYTVELCGEAWQAVCPGATLKAGEPVRVVGVAGITLTVEPLDASPPARERC
ncbi:NfeD family protein (plasmid) [Burkholderia thailandensis]|uniref:NfeD family protein n=1 Tax=Burkholderia thailandensis TaxID=57975 RepID=UPI00192DFB35|nr:NfeD family protein [Burkholderia thailandensis]MBS2132176.1 NfeD family protein [Burkholderia thailandensis]QRA15276.1 NfeD family protein [Burkholderia thailandensis]